MKLVNIDEANMTWGMFAVKCRVIKNYNFFQMLSIYCFIKKLSLKTLKKTRVV